MRSHISILALGFGLTQLQGSVAQTAQESLLSALEEYPELFIFRSLLASMPTQLDAVLDGKDDGITVLVPTNDAIADFLTGAGLADITEVEPDYLQTILQYHVMDASLTSEDFGEAKGLTVPTRLVETAFNNRTAGAALKEKFGDDAIGQVIVAKKQKEEDADKLRKRQSFTGPIVNIRSGLAQDAEMTAIDGTWGPDGMNSFQVIDKVLAPPRPCSTTARTAAGSERLTALDTALNRTELWPALNTSFNVTCLAPSTEAFTAAGSPHDSLDPEDLTQALLFHTLTTVTYTTFLEDGMTLKTLNDQVIRVRMDRDDIYFNNAKVIEPNVLTNNGLIHILDAVMAPEDAAEEPTSTGSSEDPSATSDSKQDPSESPDAAGILKTSGAGFAAILAAGLVLL